MRYIIQYISAVSIKQSLHYSFKNRDDLRGGGARRDFSFPYSLNIGASLHLETIFKSLF